MGRGTVHQAAQIADPDETLPRPVFPGEKRIVRVLELPVEEQGFAHRRVEAEPVWLYEAVGLQLLVGLHVLAQRCLEPRGSNVEKESAKLPDVLVKSVQRSLSLCG